MLHNLFCGSFSCPGLRATAGAAESSELIRQVLFSWSRQRALEQRTSGGNALGGAGS